MKNPKEEKCYLDGTANVEHSRAQKEIFLFLMKRFPVQTLGEVNLLNSFKVSYS